jgi:fructokinase
MAKPMFAAIEAGGTKFVCGLGTSPTDLATIQIPTTTPAETLPRIAEFFAGHRVHATGLACFGPLGLNAGSPAYGHITATPKLAWRGFPIVTGLSDLLQAPVYFDTDVNAAALAEGQLGTAQGLANFVYFTVGTGIGGGAVNSGRLIHGQVHPEMGHIPVRRHPDDQFPGLCPSHADCLEGMASGPAMAARWQASPKTLPPAHPAWALEAYYLAQAALTTAMMLSPELVVFGGGVSKQTALVPLIQAELTRQVGGYLTEPPRVAPTALSAAGLLGAFLLAQAGASPASAFSTSP